MKAVALVIVILALACSSFAASGIAEWSSVGDARIKMGTHLGASDTLDGNDLAAAEHNGWIAGSYHSPGEWGSSAGFYAFDLRTPLAAGETKTWMLYIWGVPGEATSDFGATWTWWPEDYDQLVQGRLELVQKPTGITGGPAVRTVWTTPPTSFALPLYTTTDGLTGYVFKFTLTAVPEPSSVLALVGGIAGLGGFALKRKRG